MKNIHVLPIDKPSRLYINARYKHYEFCELPRISTAYKKCHNIYITSDDKFVRDEYITDGIEVIKATAKLVNAQGLVNRRNWRKVILTTDQDLIKNGVQAIDDEFLEWFVKNPSWDEVEVEKIEGRYVDYNGNIHNPISYKIIIPKEEPKQESFVEKMIPLQLKYNLAMLDVMKQESLDEIEIISKQRIHKYRPMNPHPTSFFIGFRDGYKLARETSYSKEEVLEIIRQYALEEHLITSSKPDIWFEQFKKK